MMDGEPLPIIDVEVTSERITARPRKLRGAWSAVSPTPCEIYTFIPRSRLGRVWDWITSPFRKKGKEILCSKCERPA